MSIYENCKNYSGKIVSLKKTEMSDVYDLLKCYSDKNAVPFFNSDNCNGDDFFYETVEQMEQAVKFWQRAYKDKWFVRWTVFLKEKAIGTIEIFHRTFNDAFNDNAILRIDLRSDFEKSEIISDILSTVESFAYDEFSSDIIATKGFDENSLRAETLKKCGYIESKRPVIGHDGTEYYKYYIKSK